MHLLKAKNNILKNNNKIQKKSFNELENTISTECDNKKNEIKQLNEIINNYGNIINDLFK